MLSLDAEKRPDEDPHADIHVLSGDEDEHGSARTQLTSTSTGTETDRLLKLAAAESLKGGIVDPVQEATRSFLINSSSAALDLGMQQVDETADSRFVSSSNAVVDMQEVPKNRPRTSSSR